MSGNPFELATSATIVTCSNTGQATQCTATVKDSSSEGQSETPTGSVNFSASEGSFANPTCTLNAAPGGATCAVNYTRPTSGASTKPAQITASYAGDSSLEPSSGTANVFPTYEIETKAWIPFPYLVDPERLLTLPYLANVEGDCYKPPSYLAELKTTVGSLFRGDNHIPYEGSYRVRSVVSFAWDGSEISNFQATGSYGTTHRDLVYETPTGQVVCNTSEDTATKTTSGSGAGSAFSLGYSSSNPLIVPASAAPGIDSGITGTIAPDGTLTLNYAEDLFPSHGIQVRINGVAVRTDTIGDASCLGAANVFGVSGAALLGWGLTHQTNTGSLTVAPTEPSTTTSTPDPLCAGDYATTQIEHLVKLYEKPTGTSSALRAPADNTIRVAAIVNGSAGTPMSLQAAESAGLAIVTRSDRGTLITSQPSRPIRIILSGPSVIGTSEIVHGKASSPGYYEASGGTLAVTVGAQTTVISNGRKLRAHKSNHSRPVTRDSEWPRQAGHGSLPRKLLDRGHRDQGAGWNPSADYPQWHRQTNALTALEAQLLQHQRIRQR
jgi:hypothetical protein